MRSSTLMTKTTLAALCTIILAVPIALAQPGQRTDPREPGMTAPPIEGNPADHLRQRLEAIDTERAQLNDAISRLDAGEPWDEVRTDLMGRQGTRGNQPQRPRAHVQANTDMPRMIELLQEIDPEAADRLGMLRQRNPKMAGRMLQTMGPRLQKLAHLRESNPALFEIEAEEFRIERQIMHAARTLHMTIAGDEKSDPNVSVEETRDHLRELVARQLDLQIAAQRIQLGSAQDRIEKLRASIERDDESREAVIDDRVGRIMERSVRGGVNRRQRGGPDGQPPRGNRRGPDRP